MRRRGGGGGGGRANEQNDAAGNFFFWIDYTYSIFLSLNKTKTVVSSPNSRSTPAAKKSNNEYERGDIALGAVKSNADYGHIPFPSDYQNLQLTAPQTNYADASVLQWSTLQ